MDRLFELVRVWSLNIRVNGLGLVSVLSSDLLLRSHKRIKFLGFGDVLPPNRVFLFVNYIEIGRGLV